MIIDNCSDFCKKNNGAVTVIVTSSDLRAVEIIRDGLFYNSAIFDFREIYKKNNLLSIYISDLKK